MGPRPTTVFSSPLQESEHCALLFVELDSDAAIFGSRDEVLGALDRVSRAADSVAPKLLADFEA